MMMDLKSMRRQKRGMPTPGVGTDLRSLELYTRSIFGRAKKKSAQSFCRLRRQTALGV